MAEEAYDEDAIVARLNALEPEEEEQEPKSK